MATHKTTRPILTERWVYDVAAAAAALGVSPATVRRWIAGGHLRATRPPSSVRPGADARRILIARSEIERFLATWASR